MVGRNVQLLLTNCRRGLRTGLVLVYLLALAFVLAGLLLIGNLAVHLDHGLLHHGDVFLRAEDVGGDVAHAFGRTVRQLMDEALAQLSADRVRGIDSWR